MATLAPEQFQQRLDRALQIGGNTHSRDDIAQAVGEGRMQSWVNNGSLIVTEVSTFPQVNVLSVVLAVGDLDDVLAMVPALDEFGRKHGCKAIRMQGRKGWERVLPEQGWAKVPQVIFERTLS